MRFMFLGNNHSVVQTTMDAPCTPSANGFNTGFKPNEQNDLTAAPMMDLPVTATTPLYMSCLQVTHCGKGMIFTVNPPPEGAAGSHTNFKRVAITIGNPGLKNAGIQAAGAVPQLAGPAVSIRPQGAGAAAATGAALPAGTTVPGVGRQGNGQPCSCNCLCGAGMAAAPANAGMGGFGGVVGEFLGVL